MKKELQYVKNSAKSRDSTRAKLHWSQLKAAEPVHVPEQPGCFAIVMESVGSIIFNWQAPVNNAARPVTSYLIQRRVIRDSGKPRTWQSVAVSFETETALVDQPQGVQLEYRVFAVNRSGMSLASNVVAVVL